MIQNSTEILPEKLARVRSLAQGRLAKFSRLEPADCKEAYLFKDDHFCGVRFSLGAFQADWRIGQTNLTVLRGTDPIDRIEIDPGERKRAA